MLTRRKSTCRVTGAEMRYLRKCGCKTGGDRIRRSQVRGTVNQELATNRSTTGKLDGSLT